MYCNTKVKEATEMTDDCMHGGMEFDESVGDFIYTCEMDGCRDSRCPYNQQEWNRL